ncbi:hypothetical protein HMPREF9103_00193, partial [Lentilactobacillus parafarraginis F0439]
FGTKFQYRSKVTIRKIAKDQPHARNWPFTELSNYDHSSGPQAYSYKFLQLIGMKPKQFS